MGNSYVILVPLFNHNRELKVDPFFDFVSILSEISGECWSACATFNNNRELKVDPLLDFVPILSEISGEWGSKMTTV
jgi:hypothetical protein